MSSKYEPLGDYLKHQTVPTVTLTFRQIEKILGFALPDSARDHAAWWANGRASHGHAGAWTSARRKARPDLTAQSVQFFASRPGSVSTAARNGAAIDTKVAPEVWIAAALLHREHPEQRDFEIREIVERTQSENIAGRLRPGVYQHAAIHAVANRRPSPNRLCYLTETAKGQQQLYRPGDPVDPRRFGSKVVPEMEELPLPYRPLLEWYRTQYAPRADTKQDPILALVGLGKKIWKGVGADKYVRQLREEWD